MSNLAEKLFSKLLYLYPRQFRAACGTQMQQTFRDACREAYRRRGAGGLLALWLATLFDLIRSALEAWMQQGEFMMKTRLMLFAGPLTLLVGLAWLAMALSRLALLTGVGNPDELMDYWLNVLLASLIPLFLALLGTRWRFQQAAGTLGLFGLTLSVAGCASLFILWLTNILLIRLAPQIIQPPWVGFVLAACFLSIMTGYVLFGIAALRRRLLPRWNWSPVLAGATVVGAVLLNALGVILSTPAGDFVQLFITAVGWVLLGIALMQPQPETQTTTIF